MTKKKISRNSEPVKDSEFLDEQGLLIPKEFNPEIYHEVPRRTTLVTVPSGEIALESGADGVWLQFDCECVDALPYCKAHCCTLTGIQLTQEEADSEMYVAYPDTEGNVNLKRCADNYCTYNDRKTRLCSIYEHRPNTCQTFHCTRGGDVRGWKLSNGVQRLSDE